MIIPSPNASRIIVYDGLVSETRHAGSNGTTVVRYDPPVRTYFIDYHDEGGSTLSVWDGLSYAAAIAAAEDWRRDGVLVDDRVSDEGGAA